MVVDARAGGVLVERPSIEVLACDAHAERASQWQQEVDASALQEVVRAHAVEGVEVTALVEERRERAIVPREDGGHAKVRSRAVVVIARPLGNALTRVSGLLLLLRDFGQAERERIDGAEDGQAAPAQHPEPGRGRQVLREPECALEGLGSGGVGVVLLEVVALHDAELDLVVLQRLSEQPPAHSGFAQGRSAAEAQPHREGVVGCSAVSLVRIPVDRVHLQEWLCRSP